MLAKSKNYGESYNIGTRNEVRNIDLVKMICQILDELVNEKPNNISSFLELITFVDDRPYHDQRYAIDPSKFEKDFNFKSKKDFESDLITTIMQYIENHN